MKEQNELECEHKNQIFSDGETIICEDCGEILETRDKFRRKLDG